MNNIKSYLEYIKENYLPNDAIGYTIGEYIYHATPIDNLSRIKNNGFVPKDGISINGTTFKKRCYFATSLIAAYDLTVNFGSYKDDKEYIIFKIDSKCLDKGFTPDPLFKHGVYVDYKIGAEYIIDTIKANDLFDKFDDNDIEELY